MRFRLIAPIIFLIASCGGAGPESETPAASPAASPPDAATLKRGKIVFLRCRSCHTLNEDGRHLTGPNLHGLFGAEAGKKAGYQFSDALIESGIRWDAETLDSWVRQPNTLVAGNRMVFAGLPKAEDRAALIAYLREETK